MAVIYLGDLQEVQDLIFLDVKIFSASMLVCLTSARQNRQRTLRATSL
jgi:pyruvate-formate lyase-activating enzyme